MLTLRPATMADAPLLWAWRNDPVTRAMSRRKDLTRSDFLAETEAALERGSAIFIVECAGTSVAMARFDYGEQTEFGFVIAPEWRCKGLSLRIVRLAFSFEPAFEGYIKQENVACQRLMAAAGMVMISGGDLQHWRYRAPRRLAA